VARKARPSPPASYEPEGEPSPSSLAAELSGSSKTTAFTFPESDMAEETSADKWRGFLAHLGPYVIVIGMLGLLNLLTDPGGYLWFLWPALAWGVGLAFHLRGIILGELTHLSEKWQDFLGHFSAYAIIIGALILIYLRTNPGGYPWFLWPAAGWGIAVAIHLWGTVFGDDSHRAKRMERRAERWAGRWGERQTDRWAGRWAGQEPEKAQQQRSEESPPTRKKLKNPSIQAHVDRARAYRVQIDSLTGSTSNQTARKRLQDLANQVSEWTEAIEALGRRVDNFQQNSLIQQDLETVPRSIEKLKAKLATETDKATRTELERTLANRENQLAALQHLQNTMKWAEIKIERTLSSLGTIYPQILTGQSTNHVADYSRLSAEVDEEVRTLQDHLEALEEVKLGRM
jgi:hypothetical protein